MNAKEKAKELIKRYYRDSDLLVEDLSWIQAKECALIAVEEILNARPLDPNYVDWDDAQSVEPEIHQAIITSLIDMFKVAQSLNDKMFSLDDIRPLRTRRLFDE